MNNKSIEISVIIPVYNVENYLEECLRSVLMQVDINAEIICVNDGSTDGSEKILNEYKCQYHNIKVYKKENGGLSSARNYGLERANGKYIYFLDSDDLLTGQYSLSFIYQEMEKHNLDILYFDGLSFFESEELHKKQKHYERAYQRKKSLGLYSRGYELFIELKKQKEYYSAVPLQAYRKTFLEVNNLKFIEGILYEDNPFSLDCILQAQNVMHVKKCILLRRIRNSSIMTSKVTMANYISILKVYESILKTRNNNLIPEICPTLDSILEDMRENIYQIGEQIAEKPVLKMGYTPLCASTNSFPYYLFPKGSDILIYGAGKVGKEIYRKALKNNQVNIVGIVDKKGADCTDECVTVSPVDTIQKLSFDYLLIAVADMKVAAEIKKELLTIGIDENKIIWEDSCFSEVDLSKKINYYTDFIKKYTNNPKQKKMYLFMLPEHGNMGDYAIGYAEISFLESRFSDYQLIPMATHQWLTLKDTISDLINEKDIIFITGGGYLGDLWNSGTIVKEIISSYKNNIKIMLPNTLTYKEPLSNSNKRLHQDMQWFNAQENLYLFFRDMKSFTYCSQYYKNSYYAPDMALFLHYSRKKISLSDKILLCFRNDQEKIFTYTENVVDLLNTKNILYEEFDINLYDDINQKDGQVCLDKIIAYLQSYNLIITDRLHGMVLSAISNTPCIAFDNSTAKVSGVYEWIKDRKSIKMMDNWDEKIFLDYLENIIIDRDEYFPPKEAFDSLEQKIRELISL